MSVHFQQLNIGGYKRNIISIFNLTNVGPLKGFIGQGNRQQATGNRQQATGNRQQATGNPPLAPPPPRRGINCL
ncbi:MAG: hypothetical protein F6K48_11755 [Okeania sp. SIO3H1]|nr:hypothetical protein [Okeania sp. SIO3H1]